MFTKIHYVSNLKFRKGKISMKSIILRYVTK